MQGRALEKGNKESTILTLSTGWDQPSAKDKNEEDSFRFSELVDPYEEAEFDNDDDEASRENAAQVINDTDDTPALPVYRELDPNEREKQVTQFAKDIGNGENFYTLSNQQREEFRALARMSTREALYGQQFNEEAAEELEDDSGGRLWWAKIYRTGYFNKKICNKDGTLRSRRPVPIVFEEDFFRSLSYSNGQYIFQGRLNDWPGLTNLELVSLEYWYSRTHPRRMVVSKQFWSNKNNERDAGLNVPRYPLPGRFFRWFQLQEFTSLVSV